MAARVYVIDDDDRFRDSLCALIGSVGLQVTGWNNPESVLENGSFDRPGCVVLDYRLPALSGLEVLRIIRKTSSIPAILISAYADVQTAVAAMEMGASTVYEKPLDDNAFLNTLERYCFEDARRLQKSRLCSAGRSSGSVEISLPVDLAVLEGAKCGSTRTGWQSVGPRKKSCAISPPWACQTIAFGSSGSSAAPCSRGRKTPTFCARNTN